MASEIDDYNSYEDKILDVDEISGTDVKINPDYYIHTALLNAQKALNEPDIKVAYARFRMWVEHAKDLANAAGMLTSEFSADAKKLKAELLKEEPGLKNAADHVLMARVASRKLELIMRQVFANKVTTKPLKG